MIYELLAYIIDDMTPEQFEQFMSEFRELVNAERGINTNLNDLTSVLRDTNIKLDQLPTRMPQYAVPYRIYDEKGGFSD